MVVRRQNNLVFFGVQVDWLTLFYREGGTNEENRILYYQGQVF